MEAVVRLCTTKGESIKLETKKSLQTYMICLYFFISFFEPYLNGVLGAATKYYILFLAFYIFVTEGEIRINSVSCLFLLWFILKLASIIRVDSLYIFNTHLFSHIGMILLLLSFGSLKPSEYLTDRIVFTIWLGSFIIGVLSLFFSHPYHGNVETRQVLFLFGQEADPNNQAAFLLVGIAVSLYCIFKRKYIVISCITILVNVYACFLTGSRGGFLGILCIGLVFILICIREYKLRSLKWIALFAIIASIVYVITKNYLSKDIAERIFGFDSYDGGSDRDKIWGNAWELITTNANFIFGSGWGAYYGYNGVFMVLHNTFLSILCDVGIIGFCLFFIPLIVMLIKLCKEKHYLSLFVITASFVPSFFIEAINKRFFWNAIFLLLIFWTSRKTLQKNY